MNWSGGLNAATDCVESILREAYPDLDDEAVRAIGNQFSYTNK